MNVLVVLLVAVCVYARASPIDTNQLELDELLHELQRQQMYESSMKDEPDNNSPYYEDGYGVDLMTRVRKRAGNCYAMGKCLYYSKRLKTEFCGNCGNRQRCFPGDASVQLENGMKVKMNELKINDKVLAASRAGETIYSEVVAWLYRGANVTEQYVSLTTSSGQVVQLSSNHVLFTPDSKFSTLTSRFAEEVQSGDLLKIYSAKSPNIIQDHDYRPVSSEEHWSPVVSVQTTIKKGAFVPLTAAGTMYVDGVLVSCYASFDHDWAHALTSPLRWWPAQFPGLTSTEDGPRDAVERLKAVGLWLFPSAGRGQRVSAVDHSLIQLQLPQTLLISGASG